MTKRPILTKRRTVFTVLLFALLYGGVKIAQHFSGKTPESAPTFTVTVVSPTTKTVREALHVTGSIVPREEVVVFSELSGVKVKEVIADVGDVVKKGQKLAVLDNESLKHQLTELESHYVQALDAYRRIEGIQDTGAVSKESVIVKHTEMEAAKAKRDDARLALKRSLIVAPEAGVIFARSATLGSLISANEPLYRIAKQRIVELKAYAPEGDIGKLHQGQLADIQLSGMASPLEGKIRLIAPHIDDATRMFEVRITLAGNTMPPVGLFGSATLYVKEVTDTALPARAVQQDSDGYYVWKVDANHKVERQNITILLKNSEEVVVRDIPLDSKIIAKAGAFVNAGDTVTVVEEK